MQSPFEPGSRGKYIIFECIAVGSAVNKATSQNIKIRTLALGFVIRFLSGLEITKWRSHATATIVNARCNTVTI
jgi:hypothetical protein